MKKIIAVLALLVLAGAVSYAEEGVKTGGDIDAVLQPQPDMKPVNQMIAVPNNPADVPLVNPDVNPVNQVGVLSNNPTVSPAGQSSVLSPNPSENTGVVGPRSVLSNNPTVSPAGQSGVLSPNPSENTGVVGPNSKDIGTWTNPADKAITNHGMSKKRANQQKHEDNLDQ